MKKSFTSRLLVWATVLCLLMGGASFATAEQTESSDFEALTPLMDLVANAALSVDETDPEVIGNEETTMSSAFVSDLIALGQTLDTSVGITADMLTDTAQQAAFLTKVFAAQQPELAAVTAAVDTSVYIGFQPVTVNMGDDSDVQIIGELYQSDKAMAQMSDADYKNITWLDRAVYTFREDAAALNGYLLTGFSVGSELNMEEAMQTYTEQILVEYIDTSLGFSILYPSAFTDDLLVESDDGVSATLEDGSASFFVRRVDNTSNANLSDYISVIANGIEGSTSALYEDISTGTVSYDTADGKTVFDVYIVTDKYIYEAELSYLQDLASTYSMYTSYLVNSFSVDSVSVG